MLIGILATPSEGGALYTQVLTSRKERKRSKHEKHEGNIKYRKATERIKPDDVALL